MQENVRLLEEEIAGFIGARFGVGVASGTDALELSLMALGIGEGDEVITTPFIFIATAEAICAVGSKPVFCDINLDNYNIDPKEAEKKINKKTKAIIPVHLYGQACRMDELCGIAKEYKLKMVEDCAQAMGAEYRGKKAGSFSDCGCFSFFPSKNLGGYGDGWMVLTNSPQIAENLKMLRVYGSATRHFHKIYGRNSRLDEMQAAILRIKMKHLAEWNQKRRLIARLYNQAFEQTGLDKKIILPHDKAGSMHAYNIYTIRTKKKDELFNYLAQKNAAAAIYYPIHLHLQEVYRNLKYKKGNFPNSELAAKEALSLPMYSELGDDEVMFICQVIADFFATL